MYDIVIVGAGPAGATLARMLDSTFNVLILDKRNFDHGICPINKCCGGLLAPDAQKVLGHLGLGIPKNVLVGPQLFTVKTLDFDNHIERFYQRHYINIDREKFDQWLVDLIPEHITCHFGVQYKKYRLLADGQIEVTYTHDGKNHTVKTSYLVGADGGFSLVRKQLGQGQKLQRYASIQEWYRVNDLMPYFTTIFDKDITDFYSWTIPKENALLLGSAIPFRNDVTNRFQQLKQKLIKKGFPLHTCIKREGAYIIRPTKTKALSYGKDQIFLVGEAAGFISPSSAEGFSYGMRSGLKLANAFNALERTLTRQHYEKNCRSLRQNISVKNLKAPFMYHAFLRGAVMQSGIFSMKMNGQHHAAP
ncbi:FAD-binding protein [Vallitalea pronyensis]|uniref:FAD-binding protein n=1 Tax=Vallitalea pronyensis TaxID=1348613 RepID=A0A8J8MMY1_9FIRM|nr:FAD-binding protein [Vallitalea pronyensis]QUI24397.1 FAD-binding protein [Vallitalea pronyensis]